MRLLAILFFVTLVLSLGPYVPGFRHLISCRAFRFFELLRAGAWPRPCAGLTGGQRVRWLGRLAEARPLAAAVHASRHSFWVVAIVGLIELALLSTSSPGWPVLARGFQRGFDAMPWKGDPVVRRRDGRCARHRRPTRASRPA